MASISPEILAAIAQMSQRQQGQGGGGPPSNILDTLGMLQAQNNASAEPGGAGAGGGSFADRFRAFMQGGGPGGATRGYRGPDPELGSGTWFFNPQNGASFQPGVASQIAAENRRKGDEAMNLEQMRQDRADKAAERENKYRYDTLHENARQADQLAEIQKGQMAEKKREADARETRSATEAWKAIVDDRKKSAIFDSQKKAAVDRYQNFTKELDAQIAALKSTNDAKYINRIKQKIGALVGSDMGQLSKDDILNKRQGMVNQFLKGLKNDKTIGQFIDGDPELGTLHFIDKVNPFARTRDDEDQFMRERTGGKGISDFPQIAKEKSPPVTDPTSPETPSTGSGSAGSSASTDTGVTHDQLAEHPEMKGKPPGTPMVGTVSYKGPDGKVIKLPIAYDGNDWLNKSQGDLRRMLGVPDSEVSKRINGVPQQQGPAAPPSAGIGSPTAPGSGSPPAIPTPQGQTDVSMNDLMNTVQGMRTGTPIDTVNDALMSGALAIGGTAANAGAAGDAMLRSQLAPIGEAAALGAAGLGNSLAKLRGGASMAREGLYRGAHPMETISALPLVDLHNAISTDRAAKTASQMYLANLMAKGQGAMQMGRLALPPEANYLARILGAIPGLMGNQ